MSPSNGPERTSPPRARRVVPTWSTPVQGLVLILRGYTARTGTLVSVVVGTLLSAVNQGSVIISGHVSAVALIRIATNFVVPFFVSSVGYLAPSRQRRARGEEPPESGCELSQAHCDRIGEGTR